MAVMVWTLLGDSWSAQVFCGMLGERFPRGKPLPVFLCMEPRPFPSLPSPSVIKVSGVAGLFFFFSALKNNGASRVLRFLCDAKL